jgi:hypothetical protein
MMVQRHHHSSSSRGKPSTEMAGYREREDVCSTRCGIGQHLKLRLKVSAAVGPGVPDLGLSEYACGTLPIRTVQQG